MLQHFLEPLESRRLMANTVADFMPLSVGDQWQYQGTLNGLAVNAAVQSANGGVLSGIATTRLSTTLTPTGGGSATTDTRYYANTSTGLRLLRQDIGEPPLTTSTLFGTGVRFLTPTVEDGATVHFVKSFTGSSSDGRSWSGVFTGDMTVVGLENISTSVGSFESLRVSYTGSFTQTGSTGWTATGNIAETRWLVRGVGAAHVDFASSIAYSDRAPHALRYNLGLTSSSRLQGVTTEIVRGKGVDISFGDTSPSSTDGTNYTGIDVNGGLKTRVFTITNTSSQPITLAPGSNGLFSISGVNASDFVAIRQPAQTILPGQTTPFSARFDPAALGFRYATISFTTTAPGATPFQFDIRGTGVLIGSISVLGPQSQTIVNGATAPSSGTGTSFGQTAVAGSSVVQRSFTVVNSGPGPLNLFSPSRILISGANAQDFTVFLLPSASIQPGQSAVFTISFDPGALGARNAVVTILTNDRLHTPFSFAVGGTGV